MSTPRYIPGIGERVTFCRVGTWLTGIVVGRKTVGTPYGTGARRLHDVFEVHYERDRRWYRCWREAADLRPVDPQLGLFSEGGA